jgi:hypothetical protein
MVILKHVMTRHRFVQSRVADRHEVCPVCDQDGRDSINRDHEKGCTYFDKTEGQTLICLWNDNPL